MYKIRHLDEDRNKIMASEVISRLTPLEHYFALNRYIQHN